MGNYSGYFRKGLASGIESGVNMGMKFAQLKWQKKKQKELDDLNVEISDAWSNITQEITTLSADGYFSDDDLTRINVLTFAAPYQMQAEMQKLRDSLATSNRKDYEKQLEYVKTFMDYAKGADYKEISKIYETMRPFITNPHALSLFEVGDKKLKGESITPKAEVFPTPEALIERHPEATPKWTEEGFIPVFKEKEAPKAIPYNEKRFNWKVEQVRLGNMTLNKLIESEGVKLSPEKATGLEKRVQDIKTQGKAEGIPQNQINTAIKNEILGKGETTPIEPKPETVTTLKNWEQMFDITAVDGPKNEEEYNRILNLLAQSEDIYKPKYATWKEALIAEAKGIGKELEGTTDRTDRKILLNVYKQKLEEIKAKYPDVDLSQFPQPKEMGSWDKFMEWSGF